MKFMILQSNLEKDTNLFLTMNPYYSIEYGGQKIMGPKAYDGGTNPQWSDFDSINHIVNVDDTQNIKITFWNDNDEICSTVLSMNELKASKNSTQWYETKRKGTSSGSFQMKTYYNGPAASGPVQDF